MFLHWIELSPSSEVTPLQNRQNRHIKIILIEDTDRIFILNDLPKLPFRHFQTQRILSLQAMCHVKIYQNI